MATLAKRANVARDGAHAPKGASSQARPFTTNLIDIVTSVTGPEAAPMRLINNATGGGERRPRRDVS
jgi:hypothetical protein